MNRHRKEQIDLAKMGFSELYLAFVDILGFTSFVKRFQSEPGRAEKFVRALENSNELGRGFKGQSASFSAFSDSIVVSGNPIDNVLGLTRHFARLLAADGLFVRGGISRGWVLHRGSLVIGPALIEA